MGLIEKSHGPVMRKDAVLLLATHVELLVERELTRVETRPNINDIFRFTPQSLKEMRHANHMQTDIPDVR